MTSSLDPQFLTASKHGVTFVVKDIMEAHIKTKQRVSPAQHWKITKERQDYDDTLDLIPLKTQASYSLHGRTQGAAPDGTTLYACCRTACFGYFRHPSGLMIHLERAVAFVPPLGGGLKRRTEKDIKLARTVLFAPSNMRPLQKARDSLTRYTQTGNTEWTVSEMFSLPSGNLEVCGILVAFIIYVRRPSRSHYRNAKMEVVMSPSKEDKLAGSEEDLGPQMTYMSFDLPHAIRRVGRGR
jgi:hypothetical protein